MKKPRFKESQIFQVLKEAEAGVPVPELCRAHGMSAAPDPRVGKESSPIRIQAGPYPAQARGHPRQQEARLPAVLPGRPAATGQTAPAACDRREPAAAADPTPSTERGLEHGFCQRPAGRRAALSRLDDR